MFLIIGQLIRKRLATQNSNDIERSKPTNNYIQLHMTCPIYTCVPQKEKEKLLDTSGLVKLADKSPTPKYVL
jgi:hypothetical protein